MAHILVIDDDAAVREATKILLEANGFTVVTVDSGPSGIQAAEAETFDVAIVDLFMPGMDGLAASKALLQRNSSLRIIAVSGFMFGDRCPEMPNFRPMAVEAGAITALYKPFRPAQLVQAINEAMGAAA
jgi:CheY-like chemotaxis protein